MNRYPLAWPAGWKRTTPDFRKTGLFNKKNTSGASYARKQYLTVADGVQRVIEELRLFGVLDGDAIISTNIPTRLDGLPRSDQASPADPGVAVYWERPLDNGKTKVMAIDAYTKVADNLAAIAATLEAMRAIERHGGAVILDRAFQGFLALPAPGQTHARGWREVLDIAGTVLSEVRIFTYMTRHDFSGESVAIVGFDESQFLPGNNASRLAMIDSEFRVGLSATPFREDGRGDLIQLMTGAALGEDWQEFRDSGQIADVPVRVLIVKDLDHKHQALAAVLSSRKTIVFSDAIADGMEIADRFDIPFIHAATRDRLDTIAKHRRVVMSRVGDCGIDIQDLEEVIEFNFHHGSRAQSLQRLGRLLHSRKPFRHTVLMTIKEFSLYHKRLAALEAKGFRIRIEIFHGRTKRGRPPAPKPVSHWAQILEAVKAPRTASPIESQADKRARVIRRLDVRRAA